MPKLQITHKKLLAARQSTAFT